MRSMAVWVLGVPSAMPAAAWTLQHKPTGAGHTPSIQRSTAQRAAAGRPDLRLQQAVALVLEGVQLALQLPLLRCAGAEPRLGRGRLLLRSLGEPRLQLRQALGAVRLGLLRSCLAPAEHVLRTQPQVKPWTAAAQDPGPQCCQERTCSCSGLDQATP